MPLQLFAFALLLCSADLARADVLTIVQSLRGNGCEGIAQVAAPLRHNARLDRAATSWAAGVAMGDAVDRSGYTAQRMAGIRLSGPDPAVTRTLRGSKCRHLLDQDLLDVGIHRRGADSWLILAAPYVAVAQSQLPQTAARALTLVNMQRAQGARCGARSFVPAGPLTLAPKLSEVAARHVQDMASKGYLEHRDRAGRSPADRVAAGGYRYKVVGENIARGPANAEEVVQGWMQSSGHCENIMDPRFTAMGIAYAPARGSRRELYWAQLLATPAP